MNVTMLTKEVFWDIIEKECPSSFKKFKGYIDDFKVSSNWDQLFNAEYGKFKWEDENTVSKGGRTIHAIVPKFHDLPFQLQKGVIETFFLLENITYFPIQLEDSKTWIFNTIDITTHRIVSRFENEELQILQTYESSELATIAAIGVAFKVLHDSHVKNLN